MDFESISLAPPDLIAAVCHKVYSFRVQSVHLNL